MNKFIFIVLIFLGLQSFSQAEVNVRIDPLGPIIGSYGVEIDVPISSSWTLGPSLRYLNRKDGAYDVDGYGIGVRGNYWFNGSVFTQGWFFGPRLQFVGVSVEDKSDSSNPKGKGSGFGLSGLFGYQWMWEKFNINLGAGPVFYTLNKIKVDDDQGNERSYRGSSGVGVALDFSLGWKF